MNLTVLTSLLNDLPAIVAALKEAGQLTDIAFQEFQQFNTIVTLAQTGGLTFDYLNSLDENRQASYQNTMDSLVSPVSPVTP